MKEDAGKRKGKLMTHRRARFLRIILTELLLALTLLVFVFPALVGSPVQAATMPHSGGLASGTFTPGQPGVPLSPTASPASTPLPSRIWGGAGPNGVCSTFIWGTIPVLLKIDFNLGTNSLSSRYRNDTRDYLCDDYWSWFAGSFSLPAHTLEQDLHWPLDLFAHQNQLIHFQGFTPPFGQAAQPPIIRTTPAPPPPNPACQVSLILGQTWNICDPIRAIINAVANSMGQGYKDPDNDGDNDWTQGLSHTQAVAQDPDHDGDSALAFLWQTPLQPFQDDKVAHLLSFWNSSWAIVLICLVAVIAWGALRSMVGSVVAFLSYAQVIELLPRLIFALLAAALSREFFLLLIEANNALSSHFSTTIMQTFIGHPNPGIKQGLVQILFDLLGYALILEEVVRLGILYVLFAASPLLFFLAALPETQRFAQGAAQAAILLVFLQAIQTFILDVGNLLSAGVLAGTQSNLSGLHVLIVLAILYLVLVVFFAIIRMAFGPAGYGIAGLPLLAYTVLRSSLRGAWHGFSRAGMPGSSAHPGRGADGRTTIRPTSFGWARSVTTGTGTGRTQSGPGGGEGSPKITPSPTGPVPAGPVARNGAGAGPAQTGTPPPQAGPRSTRPLPGAGRPATPAPTSRVQPRRQQNPNPALSSPGSSRRTPTPRLPSASQQGTTPLHRRSSQKGRKTP